MCSRLECISEKGHQVVIETAQKRATRMIDGFTNKDYNDRLKELGLTTLETRRKRGDLIEVFKIIKGFEDVDSEFISRDSRRITTTFFAILTESEVQE